MMMMMMMKPSPSSPPSFSTREQNTQLLLNVQHTFSAQAATYDRCTLCAGSTTAATSLHRTCLQNIKRTTSMLLKCPAVLLLVSCCNKQL
jgi:hypothetical protein